MKKGNEGRERGEGEEYKYPRSLASIGLNKYFSYAYALTDTPYG